MYVYLNSESSLWTVGFYDPRGDWIPEKDCQNAEEAATRVSWLNGGHAPQEHENDMGRKLLP